jgi:hypothetical protein
VGEHISDIQIHLLDIFVAAEVVRGNAPALLPVVSKSDPFVFNVLRRHPCNSKSSKSIRRLSAFVACDLATAISAYALKLVILTTSRSRLIQESSLKFVFLSSRELFGGKVVRVRSYDRGVAAG